MTDQREHDLVRLAEDTLVAAATVSFPSRVGDPPAVDQAREAVWEHLGAGARARYAACGEVWKTLDVPVPHIHLNMIGVRPTWQGRGYASVLLDHVHTMSHSLPESEGVTLTTETARNVPFYQRAGYRLTGPVRIAPDLETWGFFRRDSGG